jgi:hypothetical protein
VIENKGAEISARGKNVEGKELQAQFSQERGIHKKSIEK